MSQEALVAIVVAVALIVGPLATLRALSKRAAAQTPQRPAPLESNIEAELLAQLPVLAHLTPELRQRHVERVRAFLASKRFIGCDGLEVTEEMKLVVAGLACLLVLRPDAELFPAVKAVLLYPGAFLVPVNEPDEFGLVDDEPQERIGESWQGDRVILSWEDVQAALAGDGVNVVAHEFAHQLDDESPFEGAPHLPREFNGYERWSRVMQREFDRLQRHRRPPVLDPYGAESPAEFFGVATEAFIQRGADLAQHHAELYELLRDYYGFDTRDWAWSA
ncbi:M90 family metallopeptidase [Hydrocarboniphaga sp.]|uniref:M90 family metallopeptidase n=1 Tax=Hydrocarboniphaga sp. TaxID=2033016 RepID=UPI002ABCFCDF|nr:M90 family metallopeptidase [Hydrocarboniphaga sp.]MDZ4080438.1 M90 family metallopeptidase [Hydrocarboniphaga sp.]